MVYRRNIVDIVVSLLLLVGIAGGSIYYVWGVRAESEHWEQNHPALCVAAPQEAHVYVVKDARLLAGDTLPMWSNADSLPVHLWCDMAASAQHPLYVATYCDGSAALWCATKENDVQRIVGLISHELCDDYTPVEETVADGGRLLHFATSDGRFLHLYLHDGVMGCSYDINLLTQFSHDETFAACAERYAGTQPVGMLYYDDVYKYLGVECHNGKPVLRVPLDSLPRSLTGKAHAVADVFITSARTLLQASCPTEEMLADVVSLAVVPLKSDTTILSHVLAVEIADEVALRHVLRPCFTSNGYRIPAASLAKLLPESWLASENYFLAIRDGVLFASPLHRVLWDYIGAWQWGEKRLLPPTEEVALLFISDGTAASLALLPDEVTTLVPPFAQDKALVMKMKSADKGKTSAVITLPAW